MHSTEFIGATPGIILHFQWKGPQGVIQLAWVLYPTPILYEALLSEIFHVLYPKIFTFGRIAQSLFPAKKLRFLFELGHYFKNGSRWMIKPTICRWIISPSHPARAFLGSSSLFFAASLLSRLGYRRLRGLRGCQMKHMLKWDQEIVAN